MIIDVVTASTILPVSIDEAAAFARVVDPAENPTLLFALNAAVEQAEAILGRRLTTTTLELKLQRFPVRSIIDLPETPVQSVTSVKYYDTDNAEQTLTVTTEYLVLSETREGAVYLPDGGAWPSTYDRPDAVTIQYVAGWTSAALVPALIRQWILQATVTMYEHREHTVIGTIVTALPRDFAMGLLDKEITTRIK